jgi:phosphoglycerate dehydrogenase-like enzyme
MLKLLATHPLPDALLAEPGVAGQVQAVTGRSEEELLREVVDADALVGGFGGGDGGRFQRLMSAATRLRWVHTSSAGVDPLLCPELVATGAVLTCSKGEVVGSLLAEHAFALLLSLSRGVAWSARQRSWQRGGLGGNTAYELRGKTLGLIGYGGTGEALARRAVAFDMRVMAVRRSGSLDPAPSPLEALWGLDRLDEMLATADAVVSTIPGTAESRGQIGARRLRLMKQTALFVNVGRGETVVTEDLIQGLREGWIGGAGLDVVDPEPLPEDNPLWRMENVVVSPHIAGNSPERAARNRRVIAENLRRLVAGEPLVGVVDPSAGY